MAGLCHKRESLPIPLCWVAVGARRHPPVLHRDMDLFANERNLPRTHLRVSGALRTYSPPRSFKSSSRSISLTHSFSTSIAALQLLVPHPIILIGVPVIPCRGSSPTQHLATNFIGILLHAVMFIVCMKYPKQWNSNQWFILSHLVA